MSEHAISLELPAELVEAVALRVAELLSERESDPWLNVEQAAEYIGAAPQRIYDLRREGKLPRKGDGRRVLVRRSALDAYLEGQLPA